MTHLDGIITGIINFALFGLVLAIRKHFHKEGVKSFLIHADRKGWLLFFEGSVAGVLLIVLYALITIVSGNGVIYYNTQNVLPMFGLLFALGFGFLGVSFFEESLFRGYIMLKLLKRFNAFIAIGVPAAVFGLIHYGGYSGSPFVWVGITNAFLIAVVLSLLVLQTGSLMFPLGYHLFWNLSQSLLTRGPSVVLLELNEGLWAGSRHTIEAGLATSIAVIFLLFYTLLRFGKGSHGRSLWLFLGKPWKNR